MAEMVERGGHHAVGLGDGLKTELQSGFPPMQASAWLLAIGSIGIGILGLLYRDFLLQYQPVPAGFPAREVLAIACAALSLACGVGLLIDHTRSMAAWLLIIEQLFWTAVAQPISVWPHRAAVGPWIAVAENAAILSGLMVLAVRRREISGTALPRGLSAGSIINAARWLFAFCLVLFAAGHFIYLDFTARMIPDWLPAPTLLAWLTGACHLAAAVGLASRRYRRLAATLEAVMMGSFVLLVHVPSLFGPLPFFAATAQAAWTALLIALSLTGAAAAIAASPQATSQETGRTIRRATP